MLIGNEMRDSRYISSAIVINWPNGQQIRRIRIPTEHIWSARHIKASSQVLIGEAISEEADGANHKAKAWLLDLRKLELFDTAIRLKRIASIVGNIGSDRIVCMDEERTPKIVSLQDGSTLKVLKECFAVATSDSEAMIALLVPGSPQSAEFYRSRDFHFLRSMPLEGISQEIAFIDRDRSLLCSNGLVISNGAKTEVRITKLPRQLARDQNLLK